MDENTLIIETQQGSLEAYEKLMNIYMHRVRAFLAMRAPVSEIIDQIANDTFIFAFNHIDEFKPGTFFYGWLTAIARNLLRAELQTFAREKSNREKYAVHIQAMELWRDVDDDTELLVGYLQDCVKKLPQKHKELLQMKYYQKSSTNDMASSWNKSISWIRTTLFRIRGELKKCIEAKAED